MRNQNISHSRIFHSHCSITLFSWKTCNLVDSLVPYGFTGHISKKDKKMRRRLVSEALGARDSRIIIHFTGANNGKISRNQTLMSFDCQAKYYQWTNYCTLVFMNFVKNTNKGECIKITRSNKSNRKTNGTKEKIESNLCCVCSCYVKLNK